MKIEVYDNATGEKLMASDCTDRQETVVGMKDLKVEWTNKDWMKENFFKEWGKFSAICYDTNLDKVPAEKIGMHCFKAGHHSGNRHMNFTFEISGLPRSAVDQLVRANVGFTTNVQSWRYVDVRNNGYGTMPAIQANPKAKEAYDNAMENARKAYAEIIDLLAEDDVKGEPAKEAARGVLGIDFNSKVNCTMTLEALIAFANKRLCTRAQWYIRTMAKQLIAEVVSEMPELKSLLVPQCVAKGYCPEKNKGCPLHRA